MASFQKTLDIDTISIRKLNVKGINNTQIPINYILVTEGNGETRWRSIAEITSGVSFNTFITRQSTFTASAGNTQFSILDSANAGLAPVGFGNAVTVYAKAFGQIDVDGVSSIYSFNTFTGLINSNVRLTGAGTITLSTNTALNQIQFYSPNDATSSLSTVVGQFTGLNTYLSTSISSFNSPFSTFIYNAISSYSTVQGPLVTFPQLYSTISSFSTVLGPTVQLPQMITAFSSFSTVLGPTVQVPQLYSTFSSFSTVLGHTVKFSQLYSTFSTFSTVLGPTVTRNDTNNNFYIGNLDTSSISFSGLRQPYIQYGSNTLVSGSKVITLTNSYVDANYNIQLTYTRGSPTYTLPLYSSNVTSNTFSVHGNQTANFFWTTYGNVF